jgi:hypothetical protein
MAAATISAIPEWVERLKEGTLDLTDLKSLEGIPPADVVAQITAFFPVKFLDRTQRNKRELGLAQVHRRRIPGPRKPNSRTPLRKQTAATDAFHRCVLLTCESDHLTTLAVMTLLRTRSPRAEEEPIALSSGAGFSLYHDPDGWKIKLLEEKTITLSRQSLHARGWQLAPLP